MRRLVILVLVLAFGCGSGETTTSTRVIATPEPVEATALASTPAPTNSTQGPAPVVAPTRPPTPIPTPAAPIRSVTAFRQLGSWIDVFDHTDDPSTVLPLVRGMAAQGTKTLYLETSRYASETDIQYPKAVGAGLDEAKSLGMRVVSWYPPAFEDLNRDIRRSLAAIRFTSPKGNRFDAFAADIEYRDRMPDHAQRSDATIRYSKALRAGAPTYSIAAIVIAPSSLEVNPDRWPDFPWAEISPYYDVFMPMNYWTGRGPDAATATDLTRYNTSETRRLTGKPVHIVGGIGTDADEEQTAAYVAAAREAGSLGGGLYDYRTTRLEVWDELRRLNQ